GDGVRCAGRQHLDATIYTVAQPAAQPEAPRCARRPNPVADTLHLAGDPQAHGLVRRHHSNSRMTWSTATLSPGLARIRAMRPSRSARNMFSIFIASTTASGSPAFTSWPWVTAT